MRKILKWITCVAVILSPLAIKNTDTVHADDSYAMACSAYEVDTVNDDGSLQLVSCYDNFSDAKAGMSQSGNDAVVRHVNSKSPSKIIAMTKNGGVGYAYTERNGGGLLYINGIGTSAQTYMQSDRELYYIDTLSYNGDGTGTVEVEVRGFHGTVDLKNIDLVPTKYSENDLQMTLGNGSIRNVMNTSFYQVEQNGAYKDLVLYGYNNQNQILFHRAVGPAADWMNVDDVYYSSDDVNFYWDTYHTSLAGTYYNYYQFAPLRTQSSISADEYNAYLSSKGYGSSSALWNSGQYFVDDQNAYGINAAMVFAQAICESGYGTSNISRRNNLFGVNAVDSNPNAAYSYSSVKNAIDYQMGTLLRKYVDDDNSLFYGPAFGNKGTGVTVKYASNIYYGSTLAAIYYDFDKFASGNNGSLTDSTGKTLGVMNSTDGVYTRSDGSDIYQYNYQNNNGYQNNATVLILGEEGDYYKIQSMNYLNSDGTKNVISGNNVPAWDWNAFVGYVHKGSVNVNGSASVPQSSAAKQNTFAIQETEDVTDNNNTVEQQETADTEQNSVPAENTEAAPTTDPQQQVDPSTESNDETESESSVTEVPDSSATPEAGTSNTESQKIADPQVTPESSDPTSEVTQNTEQPENTDPSAITEVLVDGNPINKDTDYTVNENEEVALTDSFKESLNDSQHILEVKKANGGTTTLIPAKNSDSTETTASDTSASEENISQADSPEADISVTQSDVEQNQKQADSVPQTNDHSMTRLYGMLMVVAVTDALLILWYRKRRRTE